LLRRRPRVMRAGAPACRSRRCRLMAAYRRHAAWLRGRAVYAAAMFAYGVTPLIFDAVTPPITPAADA